MSNVLVIAPHPDDEILGVGGTMIRATEKGDNVYVCIVTKGMQPMFSAESVKQVRDEAVSCHEFIGVKKTFWLDFPASMLEKADRAELNGKLLEVIKETCPDEVYLPHWGDMQKDHQIVTESAMVALRPKYLPHIKKIYAYETLSETGWNVPNIQNEFIPTVYVDITKHIDKKLEAMNIYKSQVGVFPETRSVRAVESLARYRGCMMNLEAAEAFTLIREIYE